MPMHLLAIEGGEVDNARMQDQAPLPSPCANSRPLPQGERVDACPPYAATPHMPHPGPPPHAPMGKPEPGRGGRDATATQRGRGRVHACPHDEVSPARGARGERTALV